MGAENSVPPAALPKQQSLAAIGFHGTLFLRSTNFILPLKMLIGFYPVNLQNTSIPFDEKKWHQWKSLFWPFLVTPLEQWGVEKWDCPGYFHLPDMLSANFQPNP